MTPTHIIGVASPSFSKNVSLVKELSSLGYPIVLNDRKKDFSEVELIQFLKDNQCTIAIVGKEKVTERVLSALPHLKAIAKYGVGVDNIDFKALEKNSVAFGHTAGVNRNEVAEQVLGFIIGHFRRLFVANNEMHYGVWNKNGGRSLEGLKVGIIGFGHVGTAVAKLLAPFQCALSFTDIIDKSVEARALQATPQPLDELIKTSDVVTVHVPLTDLTRNMINKDNLSKFRPDAFLINTARGEVADFAAVIDAVKNRQLGGYAADVFETEPVDLSPHRDCQNLYFTPHIAANSQEAVLKMGRSSISWVRSFTAK